VAVTRAPPGAPRLCHSFGGHRPRCRVQRDPGGAGGLGVLLRGVHRRGTGGAFFSVTVWMEPKVKAAIAAIPDTAWTPIRYPRPIWDDQLRCWVSDAEVAEVPYTAFASKKDAAVTARLIVRRVKDLNRDAAPGQGELPTIWRYHAVFTDSPFTTLQAEQHHRDHAQAGQVFADLADGALAHLPSGRSPRTQPGWPAPLPATPAARRRVPGQPRLCQSQRRHAAPRPHRRRRQDRPPRRGQITLHLPEDWHQTGWMSLFDAACGLPAAAA
jgi:hypothetical protein